MPLASFHRTICRELPLKIINIALCSHTYHAVFPPISFCNWFFSTPSVLHFLSVIRHKFPRYNHTFTEKAQHLWRWISLRTLTRGRLVPRQPRAIKGTTRTELRGESIQGGRYIHWYIDITPTALRAITLFAGIEFLLHDYSKWFLLFIQR